MNRNAYISIEMMKQTINSKHMNQPVINTHLNYKVKNYKQYSDVEKEEICMKMWFEEKKEIRTKQHEKSLPHYESEQRKSHYSSK